MNPLKLFEKWINEHGSAAILRDHNALLKSQNEALAAEMAKSKAENEVLKSQLAECKAKAETLQSQIDVLKKEIEKLNSVRVALKDQTQLQNRIAHLEEVNSDLERQLRIKSIGF